MEKHKTCSKCLVSKQIKEFTVDNSSKDGRYSMCKTCKNLRPTVRATSYVRKPHGQLIKDAVRQKQIVKYGIDLVETLESLRDTDY